MKLKEILYAFGLSTVLGYLYLSGRVMIESAAEYSGFNYLDLVFDFNDYAYYGFLYNITTTSFLFLIIASTIIYFFTPLPFRFEYVKIKLDFYATFFLKRYISKQKDLKPKSLFRSIVIKNHKDKIKNKRNVLSNRFFGSYVFMIFLSLFLMSFLTKIVDFTSLGRKNGIESVLSSKKYIAIQNKKYFKLICGKDKCIYSTKTLDDFKKIKEENYEIKELKALRTDYQSADYRIYVVDTENSESKQKMLLQINYNTKNLNKNAISNIEFRIHTQDNNPYKFSSSFNKRCFKAFSNETSKSLNSHKIDAENDTLPFFTYVEIPLNQKIRSIEPYSPAKNIRAYNYCT